MCMKLYSILLKPIQTEKTTLQEMENAVYCFEVAKYATKIDIKKAVKDFYGVEVEKVNIVKARPKFKYGRKRGSLVFRRREYKKAYVILRDKKASIDFSIIK